MPYITWSQSYSTGLDIFDEEHKVLIGIINDLYDVFAQGVDRSGLQAICDRLVEYTLLHFRHEEMYFNDWDYPDKLAHEEAHRQLRGQVFVYREQLLSRPCIDLASDIWGFLARWLIDHIESQDKQYGEFLRAKGLR